jgi:flavin reductase (DIM6/NTAB) family NADH-FMN oxidoreductase RutF
MFYEPRNGHGLSHDPFRAIVAPRPIGWITSIGADGNVNLAPYSFFNGVSNFPPMVAFCSEGYKDSIKNIEETREFVANLATLPLKDGMNETSRAVDREINEFETSGLKAAPSNLVKPPRVADTPAALECKVTEIFDLKDLDGKTSEHWLVVGQVVGVHLDERCITADGLFDIVAAQTIARCGYWDYTQVTSTFRMRRPDAPDTH